MAKPAAVWLPQVSKHLSGSARVLAPQYVRYLEAVRKLVVPDQRPGACQQAFMPMMHVFMQELCGYPRSGYLVTTTADGEAAVGSAPHVVPTSYKVNTTLFYFTPAADADEIHDLWVKQAQVYLADPPPGDVVAAWATRVVFTNFFIIDGASKDRQTGAWHLWSVADVPGATMTRFDLRHLEDATALEPTTWDVVYQRLQTLQYQAPSDMWQEQRA
jgi:hypothetical protein